MEQNAAFRMAQNLYEQKNYLGAAQAGLELMKEPESEKQGHLLFTKAFLFLIPNVNDEEKLNTLYSSAGEVGKRAGSAKELFDAEAEIMEAYEEWKRERFTNIVGNLEKKPTQEYWGAFINLPVPYLMVGLQISASMLGLPSVKKMLESEGGGKSAREKYGRKCSNEFTDDELHTMIFNAARRIHKRFLNHVRNNLDGSSEYVKAQIGSVFDQLYTIDLMFGYSIPEAGKGDDQVIISRLMEYIKFVDDFLAVHIYPNGRELWLLQDDTRRKWSQKRSAAKKKITDAEKRIEKAKEEEKRKRIAAYWEAHAEEKAKLDAEHKQLQDRIRALNAPIQKADNDVKKLEQSKKDRLPAENDCEKQRQLIRSLEEERSKCGIFKGKQKKALTERLDLVEKPRLAELEKTAEAKKKERNSAADVRIAEVLKEAEPHRREQQKLIKRKNEIEQELTRDR